MKRNLAKSEKMWAHVLIPENIICCKMYLTRDDAVEDKFPYETVRVTQVLVQELKPTKRK